MLVETAFFSSTTFHSLAQLDAETQDLRTLMESTGVQIFRVEEAFEPVLLEEV